jgi:hypothetical protein
MSENLTLWRLGSLLEIRGCGAPIRRDDTFITPKVKIPCVVVLWQYADECYGGNGFDCNRINPVIDRNAFLAKCVLAPEKVVAQPTFKGVVPSAPVTPMRRHTLDRMSAARRAQAGQICTQRASHYSRDRGGATRLPTYAGSRKLIWEPLTR